VHEQHAVVNIKRLLRSSASLAQPSATLRQPGRDLRWWGQVHYEGTHHPAERAVHMAASHDGHHFYYPCGNTVKVYDTHWGPQVCMLKGHFAAVNCVVASTRTAELYRCALPRPPLPFHPHTTNDQRGRCVCERLAAQQSATTTLWSMRSAACVFPSRRCGDRIESVRALDGAWGCWQRWERPTDISVDTGGTAWVGGRRAWRRRGR
jgi:hypothetical protein